jgi:4-aminobutyrate aminotransferase-like enzyme
MAVVIPTPNRAVSDTIRAKCIERGLLLVDTHKPSIKFAPPLTLPLDWFLKGISIFEEVVVNHVVL